MDWFSHFLSELSLLFREMYALELVVGVAFFGLGLWNARAAAQKNLQEQELALKEAQKVLAGDGPKPDPESYEKARSDFGSEPVSVDLNLGVIFPHQPCGVDDLRLIDGLTEEHQTMLNSHGIYRFRQISHWNPHNVTVLGKLLGVGDLITEKQWIGQAKGLTPLAKKRRDKHGKLLRGKFAGESVAVNPQIGIIYLAEPDEVDDLKQLRGINAPREKKLNNLGIYRFKQIGCWSMANARTVDEDLGLKEGSAADLREDARKLAKEADAEGQKLAVKYYEASAAEHFANENIIVDKSLGILFESPPDQVDDLIKIKGIAKVLRGRLNELGIYRHRQIALWDRYAIRAFASKLNTFEDRIYRDRWVEQAKDLCQELPGSTS